MDELWYHAKTTDLGMPDPDFLFPMVRSDGVALPWTAMQYADALKWIRHMATLLWKSKQQDERHLTVHSMKSTLLWRYHQKNGFYRVTIDKALHVAFADIVVMMSMVN